MTEEEQKNKITQSIKNNKCDRTVNLLMLHGWKFEPYGNKFECARERVISHYFLIYDTRELLKKLVCPNCKHIVKTMHA